MAKTVPNIVTTPPGPEATKWLERNRETIAPYNRPFYYPLVVAGNESRKGDRLLFTEGLKAAEGRRRFS